MIKEITEDLTHYLVRKHIVTIDEQRKFAYGLEVLILNTLIILIQLLISAIFWNILHFCAFILCFSLLRIYSGGYHGNSNLQCMILTSVLYTSTLLLVRFIRQGYICPLSIIFTILASCLVSLLAPVENPNQPLSVEGRIRNRKRALAILTIIDINILVAILLRFQVWAFSCSTMVLLAAILLLMPMGKRKDV